MAAACLVLFLLLHLPAFSVTVSKQDSLIVAGYVQKAKENWSNTPKLRELSASTMVFSILKNYHSGIGFANKMMARAVFLEGDYTKAMEKHLQALEEFKKDSLSREIASSLRGISSCYFKITDYSRAMTYVLDALKIDEAIAEDEGMGGDWNVMGNLYRSLGNTEKAIEAFKKSIEFNRKANVERGVAIASCNLAGCYEASAEKNKNEKQFNLALDYFNYYLRVCERVKDYSGEAVAYQNIGNTLFAMSKTLGTKMDFQKIMGHYLKSLTIAENTNYSAGAISALISIAALNRESGQINEAVRYYNKAIDNAKGVGQKDILERVYGEMSKMYGEIRDYKNAYDYHTKFSQIHDSLYNEQTSKQINEMNARYETEKKDKELLKKDRELVKEQAESKQKAAERNVFIAGLLVVLIGLFFIFRSYLEKKRINVEVTRQKDIIETKNKEILDSITYAQSIQSAILPANSVIKEILPDSFVLYKPKDIVSGDFYWMEKQGPYTFIAAADCTGHGVPGAIVSVICSNALNRSVKEFGLTSPGAILDKARELVMETFEKSERGVKDGMDISLCCLDRQSNTLNWSGANNPLWIIRHNNLLSLPADKQPVGYHPNSTSFTSHTYELRKEDMLYLFTDGYADQFGGPRGKKYKYRQLQELLLAHVSKPLEDQKKLLENDLEKWKGDLEQVDDILLIGIKI